VHLRRARLPAPSCWPGDHEALIRAVRSRFPNANPAEREVAVSEAAVAATFLYTVFAAMKSAERRTRGEYVHNGKRYRLDAEKAPAHLTGHIRDLETQRVSTFRLWPDGDSGLPRRIEFSPRPYLRIALELDPKEEI
jgi:hypothetical protein